MLLLPPDGVELEISPTDQPNPKQNFATMIGAINRHKRLFAGLIVASGVVVGAVLVSGQQKGGPTIQWSEPSWDVTLSPGETDSRTFKLTSSADLSNVSIEAVPALAPYITVRPRTISRLRANTAEGVEIAIAIPASTPLARIIREGTEFATKPT